MKIKYVTHPGILTFVYGLDSISCVSLMKKVSLILKRCSTDIKQHFIMHVQIFLIKEVCDGFNVPAL